MLFSLEKFLLKRNSKFKIWFTIVYAIVAILQNLFQISVRQLRRSRTRILQVNPDEHYLCHLKFLFDHSLQVSFVRMVFWSSCTQPLPRNILRKFRLCVSCFQPQESIFYSAEKFPFYGLVFKQPCNIDAHIANLGIYKLQKTSYMVLILC